MNALEIIQQRDTQASRIQAQAEAILRLCDLLRSAEIRIKSREALGNSLWTPSQLAMTRRAYTRIERMIAARVKELDIFIQNS